METSEILINLPREMRAELHELAAKNDITIDQLASKVVRLALTRHAEAKHGTDANS